ncbi:hypothetical protein RND71_021280 [Anisodus tanguticus]|uniref:Uncharacterized protein n=1 Tax=Anisodus tanguticus TaxID=243964 RepID=A0AAE1VCN3_9SOLA|nr:hypothetical protein RND71_021280 [Anisodus tanguticus]
MARQMQCRRKRNGNAFVCYHFGRKNREIQAKLKKICEHIGVATATISWFLEEDFNNFRHSCLLMKHFTCIIMEPANGGQNMYPLFGCHMGLASSGYLLGITDDGKCVSYTQIETVELRTLNHFKSCHELTVMEIRKVCIDGKKVNILVCSLHE